MLVFSSTRAICPSSCPVRGSCRGSSLLTSDAWLCNARKSSSKGKGKVRALPRAPNLCLAMCAMEFNGSASRAPCLTLSEKRATMVMQTNVVTHAQAHVASITVTFCSIKRCGAYPVHMSFASANGGSVPACSFSWQARQTGASHSSQSSSLWWCAGCALQR